jgi:hypothetical protein
LDEFRNSKKAVPGRPAAFLPTGFGHSKSRQKIHSDATKNLSTKMQISSRIRSRMCQKRSSSTKLILLNPLLGQIPEQQKRSFWETSCTFADRFW